MSDTPFHRDNHYVPRVYLKGWTGADGRVSTYRILVSHSNVPLWKRNSTRAIGYHSHLYTQVAAGQETDDVEKWLGREFETPAEEPLKKARSGLRLTPDDWKHLVRFLAAQDVRTPASYWRQTKRWHESIPTLIEETLHKSIDALEKAQVTGQPLPPPREVEDRANFPSRVMTKRAASGDGGEIGAEILVGRKLWLWGIKRTLKKNVDWLLHHRWTILSPSKGLRWITSDDPVIRLNYNSPTDYNFGGGWGSKGTDIILPLDPEHLLYTQVGKRPPQRGERMSLEQTQLIRRFTAEHAWRFVFAADADDDVPTLRPRFVDPDEVQRERDQWRAWHDQQTEAEREMEISNTNDQKN